jgi:hypothetical protein
MEGQGVEAYIKWRRKTADTGRTGAVENALF